MIKGLTLKEFFKDYVVESSYTDLHQLMVTDGFIFKVLRDKLENTEYTYLYAFLSKYENLNYTRSSTYMDELLYTLYGKRKMNSLIDNYMTKIDGSLYPWSSARNDIAKVIVVRFADRWEKYIKELALEYNPIHNYDMTEHEEVNTDITVDGDDTHSLQGFNSTSFKPESQNKQNHNTNGKAEDNYRDLNRSGNIGVTTSQQMLESEIKLRDENIVIERIIMDVANFITVGVYDD